MKIFIRLLFCFFCPALAGQNTAIDSLNRLIKNAKTDTARINLLNKKLSLMGDINIDTTILLGNQIIEEAKKINYKKGEAEAMTFLVTYYSFAGDFEKARAKLAEAEKIYKEIGDIKGLGKHYNSGYGIFYGVQSKYDSAASYFQKAIEIGEKEKDSLLLSTAWQNIAIGYYMQSRFYEAINYQQKALKYYESTNDLSGKAKVLMNMGNAYANAGDTPRAERALLQTIEVAKQIGNTRTLLYTYKNLATLLDKRNTADSTYQLAMKAATLAKQTGEKAIEASSLALAAISLAKKQQFARAEEISKTALDIARSSDLAYNVYQAYSAMGNIQQMQHKYSNAIPYFEKGFAKLESSDLYDPDIAGNYVILSECYEKEGNYQKALSAFKTYSQVMDSVRRKENVRKTTELSMNYEFEKKEQAVQLEQQKRDAIAKSKQLTLLVGLVLTLILAAVAFIAYRNKQKANALLQRQTEEIQRTLAELKTTQAQLIQSEKMASLGELVAGIAHEIQNPLNFVNNFSEVSMELAGELKDEISRLESLSNRIDEVQVIVDDLIQNQQKINHHGKRADAIVKGMLQHSRISTGQKEPTDINALCDEYLRLSYHGLRAKDKSFHADIQTNLNEDMEKVNIVPQDIGRVLLNLFNNAFYSVTEKKKFAEDSYKPKVEVTTKSINLPSGKSGVQIRVKDNGIGIPQKVVDKIFQPFFTTKPAGQGTGLGLSLSYDIIKAHGGEVKVETNEGTGAEFVITIPYNDK